jgi:beta-glucosidase
VAAVEAGELDEDLLDRAVTRVLEMVDRSHAKPPETTGFDADAHHALARTAAAESAVLLKNDDALLPLEPRAGDTIAVIGEFARTPRYQGAGSSQVNPTRVEVALDELRAAVPDGVQVPFAAGFGIDSTESDDELAAEAVALAARASVAIVFLGLPAAAESEGYDRVDIDLPANQVALLSRLAEVNPRLVAVLANGSAVRVSDWEQHAAALLECWLAGQAAGGAAADLLLGIANPCGRLAETLPVRLQDTPSHFNFPGEAGSVRYGEGIFVGYRGYDALDRAVSYPFGHGLSYTTFDYTDLRTAVSGDVESESLTVDVSCRVTNTGRRRGKEVAQLYVGDPVASVARPPRELKGFAKVDLGPGETETVTFRLTARDLSYWSTTASAWVLEPGEFTLAIGRSSRHLPVTATIDISGPALRPPLDDMATLDEWLADPAGSTMLLEAVGTDETGQPRGILGNQELLAIIGNFPISTLAAFLGFGFDQHIVHDLVQRAATPVGAGV